ncbi:endonuclease V [Desulfurobacterium sp.]
MFDFKKAAYTQKILKNKIKLYPLKKSVELIGGCDLTFLNPFKTPTIGIAAFVILNYPELRVVERVYAVGEVNIPYVPGFLAFREIPLLLRAFRRIKEKPDVIMVDGHGIVHPRGLGIAAHLGVVLNMPTVGCAKKPLYGRFDMPKAKKGDFSYILDKYTDKKLGVVLRTRDNVKPVFVSPGNLIDVKTAKNLVLSTVTRYRLPEPTRLAHNFLKEIRNSFMHN